MSAAAHTPGPWYFGVMPGFGGVCITRRPIEQYGPQGVIGDAPIAAVGQGGLHWESKYPVEANARLIAAAPELLAALQELLTAADNLDPQAGAPIGYQRLLDAVTAADATILKATGAA